MTQINLLPWREAARQQKKIEFGIIFGAFIILTLVILVILHFYFSAQIDNENKRIAFLQSAVSTKQAEYVSLKEKKKKQLLLENEFNYISSLKFKSFSAVRVMSELIKRTPPPITLEKIVRENNIYILQGKAETELQITQLMKNLGESSLFVRPVLTKISEKPGKGEVGRIFELRVEVKGITA